MTCQLDIVQMKGHDKLKGGDGKIKLKRKESVWVDIIRDD